MNLLYLKMFLKLSKNNHTKGYAKINKKFIKNLGFTLHRITNDNGLTKRCVDLTIFNID